MPEKNNEDDKRLIALLSLVGIVNHADSNKQLYKISEENYARLSSLLDSANISEDEILGNVVEITHNPNLKTIYYSLGEILVKKDDVINSGTIIGKSGSNLLDEEQDNCLLFEVYYNGNTIDPEDFYNMNINELQ